MTEPLQTLHAAHGATLQPVGGHPTAMDYGDFPGEVAAIEEGVGVLVLEGSGVLLVQGPDAVVFLNGLGTSDVRKLAVGGAQRMLLCATKGKILHDVVVARFREDGLLVIAEPGEAEAVAAHLDHYHIREALELGRVELTRVEAMGPRAEAVLAGLGIEPGSVKGTFGGAPVPALRLPLGALPRLVLLPPRQAAAALVEAILAAAPGARLVGLNAQEEARIWAGVPRVGVDYGQDHLPAEASIYDRIAFDKGCYVGQETHARIHYRGHPTRKLMALAFPEKLGAEIAVGTDLYLEDRRAATITSRARLPRGGELRAIAMVRYRALQPGVQFALQPGGSPEVTPRPLATDLGATPG